MKIGISEYCGGYGPRDGRWAIESAQLIEELGYHSMWLPDHVVFFPEYSSQYPYESGGAKEVNTVLGVLDPLITASAVAAATSTLRIGTYVYVVPQRDPIVTARQVACVDQLSNGRFEFGVGVGWSAEEYAVLNTPFEKRGARMDDYLRAFRALWSPEEVSEYHGTYVDIPPLYAHPKPAQERLPVIVGGNSAASMRRIVELGDGWAGYSQTHDDIARFLEGVEKGLEKVGRSRSELSMKVGRRSKGSTPEHWEADAAYIERCAELGLDEVVVSPRIADANYEQDMRQFAQIIGVG